MPTSRSADHPLNWPTIEHGRFGVRIAEYMECADRVFLSTASFETFALTEPKHVLEYLEWTSTRNLKEANKFQEVSDKLVERLEAYMRTVGKSPHGLQDSAMEYPDET